MNRYVIPMALKIADDTCRSMIEGHGVPHKREDGNFEYSLRGLLEEPSSDFYGTCAELDAVIEAVSYLLARGNDLPFQMLYDEGTQAIRFVDSESYSA